MALSKNFKELYIVPDKKSEEWDEKVFELGYAEDIEALDAHMSTADMIYMEEYQISTALDSFTDKTVPKKEKRRLLNALTSIDYIDSVKIEKSQVSIDGEKFKVRAFRLSDCTDALKDDKDIETRDRKGKCHIKSMEISLLFGQDNDVVTGYVYGMSDKAKYLHSWVEFKNPNDVEFVIDYTQNIIINKEAYYYIKHAEPLSRISRENLVKDREKIYNKLNKIGTINIKEYLTFRDELFKDMERHKKIFEDEER